MQVQHSDLQHLRSYLKRRNKCTQGAPKIKIRFLQEQRLLLECAHFYLLPIIQKYQENVRKTLLDDLCSIRPPPLPMANYSSMQTPTRKIVAYCVYFIIAIVQKQSTYFKDTADFINKIESLERMRDRSVMMLPVSYKHGV